MYAENWIILFKPITKISSEIENLRKISDFLFIAKITVQVDDIIGNI